MTFVQDTRDLIASRMITTKDTGRFAWLRKNTGTAAGGGAASAKSILDVGCFDGEMFKDHPPAMYMGVDSFGGRKTNRILPEQIESVKHAMRGRRFVISDAGFLPFKDNTFDAVVCAEVLEHIWAPVQALQEAVRAAKNGGIILITVPDEFNWTAELTPFAHYGHMHFFNDYTIVSLIREAVGSRVQIEEFIHDFCGFVFYYVKLRKGT